MAISLSGSSQDGQWYELSDGSSGNGITMCPTVMLFLLRLFFWGCSLLYEGTFCRGVQTSWMRV